MVSIQTTIHQQPTLNSSHNIQMVCKALRIWLSFRFDSGNLPIAFIKKTLQCSAFASLRKTLMGEFSTSYIENDTVSKYLKLVIVTWEQTYLCM